MTSCAPTHVLAQLLGGTLPDEQTADLRAHLVGCPECQALLDHLSGPATLLSWAPACRPPRPPAPDEPELATLLEKLRSNSPAGTYGVGGAPAPADTSLSFLKPPVQDGDLGALGPYRVLAELGRGGMGIVLLAYDPALWRTVALKVLPPGRADDEARARFLREGRSAAGVVHDNVVPVHAVANPPDGPSYLVMQYVEGPTLRQRIQAEGRLDAREAARICLEAARGLEAAHRAGLVHRDIKPGNIILDRAQGRAKIMDFGLARATAPSGGITQAGTVLGTPEYMSPEQVRAPEQIDGRTDVYSLGVTLYEALTGEVPFRGVQHLLLQQILTDDPRPPRRLNDRVPPDLETICLHCLRKEPARRYASAAALAEDLRRFLAGQPIQARPTAAWERGVKWARRRPAVAALLALVVVVTFLGFGLVTWQWLRAEAAGAKLAAHARELKVKTYTRNIGLAASELAGNDLGRAEELLDDCPEELRGWEWYYLKRRRHLAPITLRLGERISVGQGFDLAFSPDGRLLAAPCGKNDFKIWEAATGREVRSFAGHEGRVLRLAFSPDGRLLASASEDTTVRLWDAATGEQRFVGRHPGRVNALAFSPAGRLLASTNSEDPTRPEQHRVKVWDTGTGDLVHEFPGYFITKRLVTVAFRPDGRLLASGSVDRGQPAVKVWDVTTGREVHTLRGHTEPVYSVAFSAVGQHLASASWDGSLIVWDVATGQEVFTLHRADTSTAWCLAFSPDGQRLAVGGGHRDGAVSVYAATTGQFLLSLQGHTERLTSVTFSPDSQRLASSSHDKTVKVWELETGQELLTFREHTDLVGRVIFGPLGWRLASSGEDGRVVVRDATPRGEDADPRVRTLRGHAGAFYGVAFSRDGRLLATAGGRAGKPGEVKILDVATGREVLTLPGHADRVFGVAFGPDGRLATASADKTVRLWDTRTGQVVHTLRAFRGCIHSMALSRDGRHLATSDTSMAVQLWDATTGRREQTLRGHRAFVWGVAFSPDGKLVATASVDGTVRLWDVTTGQQLPGLLPNQSSRIQAVVFSRDGKLLASADADGKVVIWDVAGRRARHTLLGHTDYVFSLAFSPDGRRLASAGRGEVKLWDVATGKELPRKLGGLAGTINCLAFSPDGRRLAAAGGYKVQGEIKIWDTSAWGD